jgi:hypothetical protein
MVNKINIKGQVAIFVIVAIVIVVAIILIFAVYRGPTISITQEFEPESFIDNCLRESLRETTLSALPQGGFVNPTDYKLYNNIKVTYLCKNINYYEPCITQYPLYITQIQQDIKTNVEENIETCFITLEDELEKRNYDYSGGEISLEVILKPEIVEVIVFRDFTLSKSGTTRSFNSFTASIKSPIYDLAYIANEIAAQEAEFCYFENVGFNILYNEYDVKKFTMSDSTKIYSIKHKKSGEEMNIAIRGCAIPAGF